MIYSWSVMVACRDGFVIFNVLMPTAYEAAMHIAERYRYVVEPFFVWPTDETQPADLMTERMARLIKSPCRINQTPDDLARSAFAAPANGDGAFGGKMMCRQQHKSPVRAETAQPAQGTPSVYLVYRRQGVRRSEPSPLPRPPQRRRGPMPPRRTSQTAGPRFWPPGPTAPP